MKKAFLGLLSVVLGLASCYDSYIEDYDYSSIYIPLQIDVRSFIVGENMKFDFGVELAGVRDNNKDRRVIYQIDNSLVDNNSLERMKSSSNYINSAVKDISEILPLPENYYRLSNSTELVIKKGSHNGRVTVSPDSVNFLSDPLTIRSAYAIGIRLISADADSLLKSKSTQVIGVKYENMLFGHYWHGGVTTVKDPTDATVINTINYPTQIPVSESKIWNLTTASPYSVSVDGYSDVSSTGKAEFIIKITDGNVILESSPTGAVKILPDGNSVYNKAKLLQDRKLYLNYKYKGNDGNWYHAKDTLTFRNRIRDGVNEWYDENPHNYD